MTITLLWWYVPAAMLAAAVILWFAWPDEPGGNFTPGGPGFMKIIAFLVLTTGALCVCLGKALS